MLEEFSATPHSIVIHAIATQNDKLIHQVMGITSLLPTEVYYDPALLVFLLLLNCPGACAIPGFSFPRSPEPSQPIRKCIESSDGLSKTFAD